MKTFAQYVEERQLAFAKHIVREQDSSVIRQCTFEPGSAWPKYMSNKKVGAPRKKWADEAINTIAFKNNLGTKWVFKHGRNEVQRVLFQQITSRNI